MRNLKVTFFVVLFWLGFGLAYMWSLYYDSTRWNIGPIVSNGLILTTCVVYLSWSALTIIQYKLLKQPVVKGQVWRCILILVVSLIIWQPLIAILDTSLSSLGYGQPFPALADSLSKVIMVNVFLNVYLQIFVFIACGCFIYYQHLQSMKLISSELESKNAKAQLNIANVKMQALQSQLSPHFLFNCLNAISSLARNDEKAKLIDATARLGELLRFAIQASQHPVITLSEEIEFTEYYVNLQQLRFGDQYEFEIITKNTSDTSECPPFVLQALVENAFTHAVESAQERVSIIAEISLENGELFVSVKNSVDQNQTVDEGHSGMGLALRNLEERLQILFEKNYTINHNLNEKHYIASVRLPTTDTLSYAN